MSFANHTLLLDPRVARVAPWIGLGLSSITVVSVCMTVFMRIDSLPMAVMFAAGAALLDVFKYLAWPMAAAMAAARRWVVAALLVAYALGMSVLSAGATYDRATDPLRAGLAEHQALQLRIVDLEAAHAADARALDALADEAAAVRGAASERRAAIDAEAQAKALQADALRARGMATPARQLDESAAASAAAARAQVADDEAAAVARLEARREQLRERLDRRSLELAELRAVPAKVTAAEADAAALLALWFGIALEVVPALILVGLRPALPGARGEVPAPAIEEAVEAGSETSRAAPETPVAAPETSGAELAVSPAERDDLADLLGKLLEQTAEASEGSPVTLRDFAKAQKIRPHRAGLVFRMAMEVGRLRKESNRYVVCRHSPISDCAN